VLFERHREASSLFSNKRPAPTAAWVLSLYTPVIVKYRDASTDERVMLEDWLR